MVHLVRLRIALVLILGVALAASVGWIVHQSQQLAVYRRQRHADLEALHEARQALRKRELQKTPIVPEALSSTGDERAALARRDATIAELNRELTEGRATITNLQAQLSDTRNEHQKALDSLNEQYQKEKDDWQNRRDALEQRLASTQADLQALHEQVADLEAANSKLKSDLKQGAGRTAELDRVFADLRDLDHRREIYLTSIMRRYRDITDQFRAMSGMLESRPDPNSGAFTGAALTRIQNAISLADDDLHQLTELNAQARPLENKLAKK